MVIARSNTMYAVATRSNGAIRFLMKGRKTRWTPDPNKARWYAYFRYAYNRKDEILKSEGGDPFVVYYPRNEDICPAGGQK